MIVIIEVLCLFFSALFSGMETGLLSADKLRISSRRQEGRSWAKSADFLLQKPERLLATTLIGTNIAVVTGAVILNNHLRLNYSEFTSLGGSLCLTFVYLLFAEIVPKSFFRKFADTVTVRLAPVIHLFFFLFLPVAVVLNMIVRTIMVLSGQGGIKSGLPQSKEDFRVLLHLSSKEAGFGYEDYRAIDDILDFGETLALEAMIPLHKYPVLHVNTNPGEVLRIARQTNQRYFPCYSRRTDDIDGYIDINDLAKDKSDSISSVMREPVFFPETKPLPDLLDAMIGGSLDVVFLTDEYGAIVGIVTHQEIASEIIGAIPGNIHTIQEDVLTLDNGVFNVSGTADLEYFNHVTHMELKKKHAETIGGYLCEKLGYIPGKGTEYIENHVKYTVLDGDNRAISRIRVEIGVEPEE